MDLPFALNVFIDRHGLGFPILSDSHRDVVRGYDVVLDGVYGVDGLAERSVFVVDVEGTISFKWVREDGENPDFEWLIETVREATARTSQ